MKTNVSVEQVNGLKINKTKTRQAVEQELKKYVEYVQKIKLMENLQLSVTEYKEEKTTLGDLEVTIGNYITCINKVMCGLSEKQQQLISEKYIYNKGATYDYIVASTIGMSDRTYYRLKLSTLMDIASKLGLNVYE